MKKIRLRPTMAPSLIRLILTALIAILYSQVTSAQIAPQEVRQKVLSAQKLVHSWLTTISANRSTFRSKNRISIFQSPEQELALQTVHFVVEPTIRTMENDVFISTEKTHRYREDRCQNHDSLLMFSTTQGNKNLILLCNIVFEYNYSIEHLAINLLNNYLSFNREYSSGKATVMNSQRSSTCFRNFVLSHLIPSTTYFALLNKSNTRNNCDITANAFLLQEYL